MKNKDLVVAYLDEHFPHASCELIYGSMFQLLVAVMLSAQTTDKAVNRVTPALFLHFPSSKEMAQASVEEVESFIKTLGLYHDKAKRIILTSKILETDYDGIVPSSLEELMTLPGVGRKTASVVLVVGYHIPAFPVDTHIDRVSKRLGWANWSDSVVQVEEKLRRGFKKEEWGKLHHQLLFLGRYVCKATKPQCELCKLCNYSQTSKGDKENSVR